MRANLFFIFLFSFLLIGSLSLVSASVEQSNNIPNSNLGTSGTLNIYANTYFNNYGCTIVRLYNSTSYVYTLNHCFGQSGSCNSQQLKFCSTPSSSNILISFQGLGNADDFIVNFGVYNSTNVTDALYQNFTLSVSALTGDVGDGMVGYWVTWLGNIFPDSDNLNLGQKFGFVFITLLVVTLLVYFISFYTMKNVPVFINYIVLLLDVLLLFYFTAIGYIPISLIIICVLILLVLAFFRLKSGGN